MTHVAAFDTVSLEAETLAFQKASMALKEAIRAGDDAAAVAAREDLEAIVLNSDQPRLRDAARRAMGSDG